MPRRWPSRVLARQNIRALAVLLLGALAHRMQRGGGRLGCLYQELAQHACRGGSTSRRGSGIGCRRVLARTRYSRQALLAHCLRSSCGHRHDQSYRCTSRAWAPLDIVEWGHAQGCCEEPARLLRICCDHSTLADKGGTMGHHVFSMPLKEWSCDAILSQQCCCSACRLLAGCHACRL